MGKGQSFLSEEETTSHGDKRHLRIVITDADENNDFLVVSVTTWHDEYSGGQDDSCILPTGCHPFIKHKSWIDYSRSRVMSFGEIFNGLQHHLLIKKEDMPPDIITLIQVGAEKTDFIPEELRRFFDYF